MKREDVKVGSPVRHSVMPQWGVGTVLEIGPKPGRKDKAVMARVRWASRADPAAGRTDESWHHARELEADK